jgi:hypothetical protein
VLTGYHNRLSSATIFIRFLTETAERHGFKPNHLLSTAFGNGFSPKKPNDPADDHARMQQALSSEFYLIYYSLCRLVLISFWFLSRPLQIFALFPSPGQLL